MGLTSRTITRHGLLVMQAGASRDLSDRLSVSPPPARRREKRMIEGSARCDFTHHFRQQCFAWFAVINVEHSRFVMSFVAGDEAVPIERSDQRPNRHGANV